MTHWGVSLVRVDTQCRTEYLINNDDFTALWLDHLGFRALYEPSIQDAIKRRQAVYTDARYLGHNSMNHLTSVGLVKSREERSLSGVESLMPSMGALLLLGQEERLRAELPSAAETSVSFEIPINSPFTISSWSNIVISVDRYVSLINNHLASGNVQIPEEMLRELLLNAYLHRCYRTPGPVQIRIREGEIEIQNPGGLLGDLTVNTLLWGPAFHRNFVLSDAARQFDFCEKAGMGVKKVFYQSITDGLDFPLFHSDINHFSVVIKTKRDLAFAKFIQASAGGINLQLPDLMIIRALRSNGELDNDQLAKFAQRPVANIDGILKDLQKRNLIGKTRGRYRLTDSVLEAIAKYDDINQLNLFH
jgi:predicted HTH transcriptional regulator